VKTHAQDIQNVWCIRYRCSKRYDCALMLLYASMT